MTWMYKYTTLTDQQRRIQLQSFNKSMKLSPLANRSTDINVVYEILSLMTKLYHPQGKLQ